MHRCLRHATIRLASRDGGLLLLTHVAPHGRLLNRFCAAIADIWRPADECKVLLLVTIVVPYDSLHAAIADVRPFAAIVFWIEAITVQVEALRPNVEGPCVLLLKMLVGAIGVDIISTGWAFVDNDWLHNRQSALGTSNLHCARFDVAGRCLAVAAATGSGNKGQLEQQNGYGRWHKYSTYDLSSLLLFRPLYHVPLFFLSSLYCFLASPCPRSPKTNQHHRSMASRTKFCDNMQDDPCEQGEAMR